MSGSVSVRVLELQHHVARAVAHEPFVGNRWSSDIAAQPFQFMAPIHGAPHLGMYAKALRVDTTHLSRWRLWYFLCGDGIQHQR